MRLIGVTCAEMADRMRLQQYMPGLVNADQPIPFRRSPYRRFGLVLVVNHACNLRCTYCYTGKKFSRSIPADMASHAIARAIASIADSGALELGFFGGEPLVEASLISGLIGDARRRADDAEVHLELSLTTNGTLAHGA